MIMAPTWPENTKESKLEYWKRIKMRTILYHAQLIPLTWWAFKHKTVLHSLYNYFSGSTSRWEVLKNYAPLTLKAESKTRWSAPSGQSIISSKRFTS